MHTQGAALANRVAVVTGALGLLGREHCRALCEAGAQVVVTDLDTDGCTQFAAELRAQGHRAIGVSADVTASESVQALCERSLSAYGQVDVLVNNAALNDAVEAPLADADASAFERYPLELFRRVIDVAVTGTFLCSQAFGKPMAQRRRGSIINVASTYALVGPDQSLYRAPDGTQRFYKSPAYPSAKGAITSFTRYLAAYFGATGVRVNALCPGGVENGQPPDFVARYATRTPLGRMARPQDYHGALVFLASDASNYMTGANLVVDGGFTAW